MTSTSFDARQFRRACGQFLTGVTIVTTRDSLGTPLGVTVNSFTSVSLDPPLVLVSLDKRLGSYQAFRGNGNLAIHVLPTDSAHVSARFARRGADKFGGLAWRVGRANVPVLSEYLALFECSVVEAVDAGDHTLLLSRVDALDVRGADLLPLGFFRGEYVEIHRPMVGAAAEEQSPGVDAVWALGWA
jgi:3-hydroxy-9,10-secoandrosta-1,3,5(10)-triene-9,17-dione monooxygenase reductase component